MATLGQIQDTNTAAHAEILETDARVDALNTEVNALYNNVDNNEPRTPLTGPVTISQSGSYYLTQNIVMTTSAAAIAIQADDVTLDLMGWAIIGNGTGAYGIVMTAPRKRVVVRNGSIREFYFAGVFADDLCDGYIKGLRIENTGNYGVCLYAYSGLCEGIVVENCTAGGCGVGFRLDGTYGGRCFGNRLSRCVARGNGYGFILTSYYYGACDGNIVEACRALDNTVDGFHVNGEDYGHADGNVFRDCAARGNGSFGWRVFSGSSGRCTGNQIRNCAAVTNDSHGIYLVGSGGACDGNMVADCTSVKNGASGVILQQGSGGTCAGNIVKHCTTGENQWHGINLYGQDAGNTIDGNLVEGCRSRANVGRGINLFFAVGNVIRDNTLHANEGAIGFQNSSRWNRLERNACSGAGTYGFVGGSPASTENLIVRNLCRGYDDNYSSLTDNLYGPVITPGGQLSTTGDEANPWANVSY
ncbi:MAG: right-handed parallel beta-helix repeat-containing protein [Lentisphaerae bacterium]|nr:right-handed parallel beta-helix repeat-containing protein [Lentisphaerota bacterium]